MLSFAWKNLLEEDKRRHEDEMEIISKDLPLLCTFLSNSLLKLTYAMTCIVQKIVIKTLGKPFAINYETSQIMLPF